MSFKERYLKFVSGWSAHALLIVSWLAVLVSYMVGPLFVGFLGTGGWVVHLLVVVGVYILLRSAALDIDKRLKE